MSIEVLYLKKKLLIDKCPVIVVIGRIQREPSCTSLQILRNYCRGPEERIREQSNPPSVLFVCNNIMYQ